MVVRWGCFLALSYVLPISTVLVLIWAFTGTMWAFVTVVALVSFFVGRALKLWHVRGHDVRTRAAVMMCSNVGIAIMLGGAALQHYGLMPAPPQWAVAVAVLAPLLLALLCSERALDPRFW
jgi:hypothetical protein